MPNLTDKRLLVLGGTAASREIVNEAHKMGVYVIVTDMDEDGVSKKLADKSYQVSTTDIEGLVDLIKKEKINGVFCGPSEFNILNTLKICKAANLPFYCTRKQWDICSDKYRFKNLCREHDVPCVTEYKVHDNKQVEGEIEYPVIVKPVDGCSSKGIKVCFSNMELSGAIEDALKYSESKQAIVEKYIQNKGEGVSVRYIATENDIYLSLMGDRYVVDPYSQKALITGVIVYPSKYTEYYKKCLNEKVVKMFKSIGIKNTSLFMQALPENGKIIFHEMGLRLSGGLTYAITEPANGINDMNMMLRYALGERFCEESEIKNIDPYLHGRSAAMFSVPLKAGTIKSVKGIDLILNQYEIESYTQYFEEGSTIQADYIGTTMQFFCRFKFFADSKEEIKNIIDYIQDNLEIVNENDENMMFMRFDTGRIS